MDAVWRAIPANKGLPGDRLGDELRPAVVHTTNQSSKNWLDTSGHYQPGDADVVERFTMPDANTIRYESTTTSREFTQPMKVMGTISRAETENPGYEQIEWGCIEGNQDLVHYTVDVGGKAESVVGLTR